MSIPRSPKSHFQKRMKWRFNLPRDEVDILEDRLMSELFMGRLKIIEECDRGLKIHYPIVHRDCILIFNKQKRRFKTGYSANHAMSIKLKRRV